MKHPNVHYRYNMAMKWYAKKKYIQAIPLIEELISHYKGTDTAESLYFLLAEGYYKNEEYLVAAYHFKNYADLYSNKPRAEDALFYNALCYYHESPRYSLDQTETHNAISNLQLFINQYPMSSRLDTCNKIMSSLRRKLEVKAYEAAKLYYKTQNYKAAAVSLKLVLKDYPDIAEREEIAYMAMLSGYYYADKSVFAKQPERYLEANEGAVEFESQYAGSSKLTEIPQLYEKGYFRAIESAYQWAQSTLGDKRVQALNLTIQHYHDYASFLKEEKNKESAANTMHKAYVALIKTNYYLAEEMKEIGESAPYYKACAEAFNRYQASYPTFITKELENLYQKSNEKININNQSSL